MCVRVCADDRNPPGLVSLSGSPAPNYCSKKYGRRLLRDNYELPLAVRARNLYTTQTAKSRLVSVLSFLDRYFSVCVYVAGCVFMDLPKLHRSSTVSNNPHQPRGTEPNWIQIYWVNTWALLITRNDVLLGARRPIGQLRVPNIVRFMRNRNRIPT